MPTKAKTKYEVCVNKIHKRVRIHKVNCPHNKVFGGKYKYNQGSQESFDTLEAALRFVEGLGVRDSKLCGHGCCK